MNIEDPFLLDTAKQLELHWETIQLQLEVPSQGKMESLIQQLQLFCKNCQSYSEKCPTLVSRSLIQDFSLLNERLGGLIKKIEGVRLRVGLVPSALIPHLISAEEKLRHFMNISRTRKESLEREIERGERFDREINGLFKEMADNGKRGLVVSCYILGDGMGDYAQFARIIRKLRQLCPYRPISGVVVSAKKHEGRLFPIDVPNCQLFLAYDERNSDNSDLGPPVEPKEFFPNEVKDLIKERMKHGALWINGPKHIPHLFDQMEQLPEMMRIVEYDRETNKAVGFKYNAKMGLGVDAKGIFIKKIKSYRWDQLENPFLKQELFQGSLSEESIALYCSSTAFYLCYIGDLQTALSFIYNAILFSDVDSDQPTIDILFPSKDKGSQTLANFQLFDLNELKQMGVAVIKMITYEKGERAEASLTLQDHGKCLRIIDVGALSKRDFNRLAFLSSSFMGCTGDSSLSLALSFGKIPYYETRAHKRELMSHLLQVDQRCFGEDAPLHLLHQSLLESGSFPIFGPFATNRRIIQSPRLREEASQLGAHVRENFSFNFYFSTAVKSILYRQDHSDYAQLEESLRAQFIGGEINLEEAKRIITGRLSL